MSYSQRETPILAELCTFLVEHVYGELAARVFSVLARFGRQRLGDLSRASYLNGRQLKYGLVILIQQHLVFHSPADAKYMFYEIDWQHSYALVRCGKIAKLVEDRFGKKAANVVSNLLTLGHTRIADLKEAYFPSHTDSDDESDDGIVNGVGLRKGKANGTRLNGAVEKINGTANGKPTDDEDAKPATETLANGVNTSKATSNPVKVNGVSKETTDRDTTDGSEELDDGSIGSAEELHATIQLLMERGWVMKVEDAQYLSPGDLHDIARRQAADEIFGGIIPTGTKDKDKLAAGTQQHKRRIRDAWLEVPQACTRKRKAADTDYGASNKRVKVNGGYGVSGATSGNNEDDLVVRVNPEKIAVAMRTEQLVHLVEQRLGYTTARIYQIMLRMLESNLARCYEEYPDPPLADPEKAPDNGIDPRLLVTTRDVAKQTKDLDICEGLDPHAIAQITKRTHVEKRTNVLSQPIDPSTLSHDERVRIVHKHISLLSEDPFHFVTWHTRAGYSQWRIEFDEIMKGLIQHEIENTIASRKGALGVKLIRALRKKGKLDERQTCNTMMMSANDIRGIVNDLTVQGFVQTQEIPRVERREAKHSIHLIWYDRQRAREKLLHDTYKGMVRIMQRIAFEREKVQPLLAKAERSDVVGNEAKYLSKGELEALKKWKEVEEKLLLQLFREDDLVATLRDFIGPLVSV
ncbi:hypothetical protein BU26DRAFT_466156 [Trematosphaeria pertusa]|uniref:DNA-directed RNA polymerase III subunit RPC3 n=1 Tax=Trematosphaeria pertusa TaxID=390896 RepID=A0A6A6HZI6_9PLEO|nr:uncharacterized protein BU26DRAFT_466156 [Trematosphaeria pertusa]KAF2243481.1 hypothetical protein BU26DRAFT_466156 [Trematosphaeria pertusa]